MSLKDKKSIQLDQKQEYDIFGKSQSRDEVKALQKEDKQRQREERRKTAEQLKEKHKGEVKSRRMDIIFLSALVVGVVIILLVALFVNMAKEKEAEQFDPDPKRSSFAATGSVAELKDDGLTAAVQEVYYTKGGYLCVKLDIGNGMTTDQHMADIEVTLCNGDSGEVIASGYTDDIRATFYVSPGEHEDYTFYISPEYVKIKDDSLEKLSYEINLSSDEME